MKCTSVSRRTEMMQGGFSYYGTYAKIASQIPCRFFTPKEEKTCGTCRDSSHNNSTGKCCNNHLNREPICNDYSHWQPIENPKEERTCRTCNQSHCYECDRDKNHSHWQPKPAAEKGKMKKVGTFEKYVHERAVAYNTKTKHSKKPPKQKENKMLRIKKWIRKFVMGCTVYCTAIICIAMNPWIYKLWHWLTPWAFVEKEGTNDWYVEEYAGHWLFTIISIAIIVLAIYVFEKITTFVFGKLEK